MPIVNIRLIVGAGEESAGQAGLQDVTDRLGRCFSSAPSGTWVTLERISRADYAENETEVSTSVMPTFVSVLQFNRPEREVLSSLSVEIAVIVSECLDRPRANVHIIFEPDGKDRVAFGGVLQ